MGKSKNNRKERRQNARHDPTGTSGTTDGDEESNTMQPTPSDNGTNARSTNPGAAPIVRKLASDLKDDRSWAAAAISNLVLEDSTRLELLKGGVIVGLATAFKNEQNTEVQLEIAGAIRNLSSFGGEEVCLEMVRRGIVNALLESFPKIQETAAAVASKTAPASEDEAAELKYRLDLSEQVILALWSLSEASVDAVTEVTQSALPLAVLPELMNPNHSFPFKLVLAAAQFLNTVTEDNDSCKRRLRNSVSFSQSIEKIISWSNTPELGVWNENRIILKVLAANIAFNLMDPTDASQQTFLENILPTLAFCLDVNLAETASVVAEQVNLELPETGEVDVSQLTTKIETTFETAIATANTIQLALELLSSTFVDVSEEDTSPQKEEDGGWQDMDADGEGGEGGEDEDNDDPMAYENELSLQIQSESGAAEGPAEQQSLLSIRFKQLSENGLISKVMNLAGSSLSPLDGIAAASPAFPCTAALRTTRIRSFECLQNLLTAADTAGWFIANPAESIRYKSVDVVEAAVSGLWAIARGLENAGAAGAKLKSPSDSAVLLPDPAHIQALSEAIALPNAPDSLQVKTVALLSILAQTPGSIATNQLIGDLFMRMLKLGTAAPTAANTLSYYPSVEVLSEVLNAVFDVYADAAFDYDAPVFVAKGYVTVLKECYQGFRSRVKQVDKRRMKEIRERADEALLNMRAFIDYKISERKGK
ncbi:hypothetical protein DFJ73DRAFT_122423 [Zopfochytrium polystomum]|nr:hypothetical protein DFJ73DRAFT_122423 [Zopfochytrium polystomum]